VGRTKHAAKKKNAAEAKTALQQARAKSLFGRAAQNVKAASSADQKKSISQSGSNTATRGSKNEKRKSGPKGYMFAYGKAPEEPSAAASEEKSSSNASELRNPPPPLPLPPPHPPPSHPPPPQPPSPAGIRVLASEEPAASAS
jgi:hypothetical protein